VVVVSVMRSVSPERAENKRITGSIQGS
jgi:hypothetical protein